MTGRHRRGAARTDPTRAQAPRPIGIVERRTHLQDLMSREVAEHRPAGRYLAVLGARVLAATLTAPRLMGMRGGAQ